jgi:hypothetical protein
MAAQKEGPGWVEGIDPALWRRWAQATLAASGTISQLQRGQLFGVQHCRGVGLKQTCDKQRFRHDQGPPAFCPSPTLPRRPERVRRLGSQGASGVAPPCIKPQVNFKPRLFPESDMLAEANHSKNSLPRFCLRLSFARLRLCVMISTTDQPIVRVL